MSSRAPDTDPERAEWVFDPLPASGARRGGNPAEHAFAHDLSVFVREVVQNANDQAVAKPRVGFRFVSMRGTERARFLTALGFDDLRAHLVASPEHASGQGLGAFVRRMDDRDELVMAFVEDYGTVGLTGDESEGESHFRALCRDTLFSHKKDPDAGGSYGLGKSVLWIFSGLSTVLFDSTLIEPNPGRANPRFIGRAELPSHERSSKRGAFAGPGWFGAATGTKRGRRAESLWGPGARSLATSLGFRPRDDDAIGTSIGIVGFRDPTSEEAADVATMAARVRAAVVENFWPAMSRSPMRALEVTVEADGASQTVGFDGSDVVPFLAAYRGRSEPREGLEQPGDVAVRRLPFQVPATLEGAAPIVGEVELVVRLDSERKPAARAGQVAVFRGPGMVVRYWDRSRIALGMRPFHAVLACGTARDPSAPTEADHAIERFLRLAEPPSHDRWIPTQRLKETYRPGYKKAIDALQDDVDAALRELLVQRSAIGREGPERLQKRFPIGDKGALDKRGSAFHVRGLVARPVGDAWSFEATFEPTVRARPWTVRLALAEVDEAGRAAFGVPIASVQLEGEGTVQLDDGRCAIDVPATTTRLTVRGTSAACGFLGALELDLTGTIGEPA